MTNSSEERGEPTQHDDDSGPGISDADLPEDLVPGEENPLAESLDDDVPREGLDMGTPGPQPDDDEDLED